MPSYSPEALAEIKAAKRDPCRQIWTEKVTVRIWARGDDAKEKFLDPVKDVEANRVKAMIKNGRVVSDGRVHFRLHHGYLAHLGAKSEIVDAEGKVYVVALVRMAAGFIVAETIIEASS